LPPSDTSTNIDIEMMPCCMHYACPSSIAMAGVYYTVFQFLLLMPMKEVG